MALSYTIVASSPATGGTNVNNITGGDGSWKSLSNPSFVTVRLDAPSQIHHIRFGNAGAAFVEILGLPENNKDQGANAKESDYKVRPFSFSSRSGATLTSVFNLVHYFITYISGAWQLESSSKRRTRG